MVKGLPFSAKTLIIGQLAPLFQVDFGRKGIYAGIEYKFHCTLGEVVDESLPSCFCSL